MTRGSRTFPKLSRLHHLLWARFWLGWFLITVVPRCTAVKRITKAIVKKTKTGFWWSWRVCLRGMKWVVQALLETRITETLVELLILRFMERQFNGMMERWGGLRSTWFFGVQMTPMFLALLVRSWLNTGLVKFREYRERRLVEKMKSGDWQYNDRDSGIVGQSLDLLVIAKTVCFGKKRKNVVYCY